jgi:hypothetical protein
MLEGLAGSLWNWITRLSLSDSEIRLLCEQDFSLDRVGANKNIPALYRLRQTAMMEYDTTGKRGMEWN